MEKNMFAQVYSLSGVYEQQTFWQDAHLPLTDLTALSGTNAYCDAPAMEELQHLWQKDPCFLRFIDSGNYHYLSYLTASQISEPFSLVLFDNHPDLQQPAFGDILSCGGWVRYALDRLPMLRRVYMIGVDPVLLEEESPLPGQVHVLPAGLQNYPSSERMDNLPLFISIDKDVLCEEDAACNWSQGQMRLADLLSMLDALADRHRIVNVDICGESYPDDAPWAHRKNDDASRSLLNWCSRHFWEKAANVSKN